jgi:hypothetical protein
MKDLKESLDEIEKHLSQAEAALNALREEAVDFKLEEATKLTEKMRILNEGLRDYEEEIGEKILKWINELPDDSLQISVEFYEQEWTFVLRSHEIEFGSGPKKGETFRPRQFVYTCHEECPRQNLFAAFCSRAIEVLISKTKDSSFDLVQHASQLKTHLSKASMALSKIKTT